MDSSESVTLTTEAASVLVRHLPQGPRSVTVGIPSELVEDLGLSESVYRQVETLEGIPEGPLDSILVWGGLLPSVDATKLQPLLGDLRDRLCPSGRLSVLFPDTTEAPSLWVRYTSEVGFTITHSSTLPLAARRVATLFVGQRNPFSILGYQKGDETDIAELFKKSFFVERTVQRWAWAYRDNPWTNLHLSLARSADGLAAAHYSGYGMPFWYRGRVFLSLHIGDTMTAEEFRKEGRGTRSLLARTVRHFFSVRRGTGLGFYYGFNTGAIQRFCRWFIGGMEVEPVHFRWRDATVREPKTNRYKISRIFQTNAGFDRLFARVAPSIGYLVRRDSEYVNWRYLQCPDTEYQLFVAQRWGRYVGWAVFRRRDQKLLFGDALVDPKHLDAADSLLRAALDANQSESLEGVEAWFPTTPTWWNEKLLQLGFESRRHPDRLGFMILPDAEVEAPLTELYYSMGDGDLF